MTKIKLEALKEGLLELVREINYQNETQRRLRKEFGPNIEEGIVRKIFGLKPRSNYYHQQY